ncbi:glycosyltransferase family 4 protein [Microbacterium limosum]|uniref:D-inositol 3-phosphate glycosyltransferase n=1 Tax=Microbacterium limosum TaxID=3079935 RepID=A0AAU0MEF9_9MICO|nr:glycosyltransferase family 4 protein [Microbacterium sp. Y20]WOQ68812.1 glycosyltransferase family 4 protein [Microbacterium sp. Y20]
MSPLSIAIAYDCLFPATTGGGERQYRAFAEDLVRRGHRVTYLTADWGSAADDASFDVEKVCGRLRLYDERGVRRTAAALSYAFGLYRRLRRDRDRFNAVIVSGLPVFNVFAARMALRGSTTRVLIDYLEVWGRAQWQEYAGPLTGTVGWVLQRTAIALTPVATCHSQLSARRLRAERLRGELLVSPGLIDRALEVTPRLERTDPPFALYVGRHIPDKRVEHIPAAVAAARQSVPGLHLVILGEGSSTPAVRRAIDSAASEEWTDMPGFVSERELHDLLARAACLVHPSRREGYGLVVVEAAAHGTPSVLVADEGNAATELIEPGVNGYIAASVEPGTLGEAIVRAVRQGDELRRTTRAWYEEAVEDRTIARTVDAILDAIQRPHTSRRRARRAGKDPDGRSS